MYIIFREFLKAYSDFGLKKSHEYSKAEIHVAKLIWAERQPDGSVSYGLEFSSEPVGYTF
ncbi:MAG: hypothetical protein GY760_17315 [Deltaproteobacteria bacterium]|nr:hypothetical protein [Deltaproteobacteria bacterium]